MRVDCSKFRTMKQTKLNNLKFSSVSPGLKANRNNSKLDVVVIYQVSESVIVL